MPEKYEVDASGFKHMTFHKTAFVPVCEVEAIEAGMKIIRGSIRGTGSDRWRRDLMIVKGKRDGIGIPMDFTSAEDLSRFVMKHYSAEVWSPE